MSPHIILSTDFSQGKEQHSNFSTVSLSVVLNDRWEALYLKTREHFPLQPARGVMGTWELSLSVLLSISWKSCSPWVMALFMCFQVCGRKGLWPAAHWQSSTYADHLGKETLEPPRELHNPPTSLKCASPQCQHQSMPQNSARAKTHIFKKKQRDK